ncbi:MAG: STAS domain-containing protein [Pseudomonadota bacterium]
MQVATEERDGSIVVTLQAPRLDHAISTEFRETVLQIQDKDKHLVIDLGHVEFMDSSGLGALVGIRKRLGWSAKIVLANVRGPVYRVFTLAKMTSVFNFYTSVEAALSRTAGEQEAWDRRSPPNAIAS